MKNMIIKIPARRSKKSTVSGLVCIHMDVLKEFTIDEELFCCGELLGPEWGNYLDSESDEELINYKVKKVWFGNDYPKNDPEKIMKKFQINLEKMRSTPIAPAEEFFLEEK